MSEHKLKLTPVVMRREDSLAQTHKSHFARLRRMLLKKHGYRCSICNAGARGGTTVEAHEVWVYDVEEWDPTRPKTLWFLLADIVLVCLPCHHAIHTDWGRRNSKQYCHVNKCTDIEYREALAERAAARANCVC